MKQKFWQTLEFKKLEKEWYQKLVENDFEDAETSINGDKVLKQRASNCYRNANQLEREAKQKYFELLRQHFWEEDAFKDEVERFVMRRKSEGASITVICGNLELRGERCYRGTIRKIIQKYEAKWQIKRR